MHNEVIHNIQNTNALSEVSIESIDDFFATILPTLASTLSNYNPARYQSDVDLNAHQSVSAKTSTLKSNSVIGLPVYGPVLVNDLKNQAFTSDYFSKELNVLIDKSTVLSSREIINYLNTDFAVAIDANEKELKDLVISVAISSNDLWNGGDLARELKPGSRTIIADAIGALWGLPFGGVGSILYGAGFSLYENEVLTGQGL